MSNTAAVFVHFLSHVQLFVTSVDCNAPWFPVLHCLPEFAQTHVHWVDDAIWPSYLLSLPSQSFPASASFPVSWLFTSGDQSTRASASVLPKNIQCWLPLGWTGLISLLSKGLSSVFSSTTVWKHQFFSAQPSLWSNSHLYMIAGKTMALTIWTFVSKVMSLLSNALSGFVIVFHPRSKSLLISWLQSLSAVILEPKKIKSATVSTFSPSICHEVMGRDSMILVYWMLSFKPVFSCLFHLHQEAL